MTREEAAERMSFQKEQVLAKSDGKSGALTTAYEMAIEALSAEAEWIPVSERLPNEDENEDEFEWYLVTVKGHGLFVDVAPFEDELWKGLPRHQEVLAWMPLPKPYRGKAR